MLKWLLVVAFAGMFLSVGVSRRVAAVETVETVSAPSMVSYSSGEDTVSSYLVLPSGEGPFPAIVVIHEWWGLNDHIEENARRFAKQGYAALAVDLYRGKVAAEPGLAHELMRGLPEDRAAKDLTAAVSYLRSRKDVDGKRIGSVGWCMGGGYSLTLAMKQADLNGSVICYGRLAEDRDALSKIGAPILGIFGGKDGGIPVESVRKFEKTLKDLGKSVEIHIYPEAGHAFMNPNNAQGYREADAKDVWKRMDAFFEKKLARK